MSNGVCAQWRELFYNARVIALRMRIFEQTWGDSPRGLHYKTRRDDLQRELDMAHEHLSKHGKEHRCIPSMEARHQLVEKFRDIERTIADV